MLRSHSVHSGGGRAADPRLCVAVHEALRDISRGCPGAQVLASHLCGEARGA